MQKLTSARLFFPAAALHAAGLSCAALLRIAGGASLAALGLAAALWTLSFAGFLIMLHRIAVQGGARPTILPEPVTREAQHHAH